MQYEQRLVTSYKNEVHLHHLILHGTNEEIGYMLGRLGKESHSIERSPDSDGLMVRKQYDYLADNYPEHYARMSGFAKAYGKTLEEYGYDFSIFGNLPEGTGCSAVYYPPEITETGRGCISRNLDFPIPRNVKLQNFPFKNSYVVEMHPESCYSSLSLMCFEVFGLALEGINSEGLAVVHLADHDTRIDHPDAATQRTMKGFNEFLPIQFVLDKCANAHEARIALNEMEHYHAAIPVHLLIADKNGTSFVFEYSPDGTGKVFLPGSREIPMKITNFQLNRLSDIILQKTVENRSKENGFDRYQVLDERIRQSKYPLTEDQIKEINASVYVNENSDHVLERTLFHCIYDTASGEVKISLLPSEGRPGEGFYTFSI